jgi:dipeptidyl aminopeptidase/acylaminoacyl peptidase
MSDQGGNGGEIFLLDVQSAHQPKNLTPGRKSTPSWFCWQGNNEILFTEFTGGSTALSSLNITTLSTKTFFKADASLRADNDVTSLSFAGDKQAFVFVKDSWNNLPEVWYGNFEKQTQRTTLNSTIQKLKLRYENMWWVNEEQNIQGWLLFPKNYDSTKQYPMLVCVHGGPAWIATPTWAAPDFNTTAYTGLGYFVFFPNVRGSYGQGENFTLANRRDWGFGDLRDILKGVSAVSGKYSIDTNRLGILGWSYGGSMAMMSITQTNKFKAAVSGAGACDWKSYYGQNAIDKWMHAYFNASPYDDPAAYEKVSAITYIKQAKTPTLVLVGERDGESPTPQSFQFWHALKELQVPTQLFVYADEGHAFENFDNIIDVSTRTIQWFETWLK